MKKAHKNLLNLVFTGSILCLNLFVCGKSAAHTYVSNDNQNSVKNDVTITGDSPYQLDPSYLSLSNELTFEIAGEHSGTINYTESNAANPDSGIVAQYLFENNLNDEIGDNDGTMVGTAVYSDSTAREGANSIALNGTDVVGLAAHVNNFPLGKRARTITAWFNTTSSGAIFNYGKNSPGQRFTIGASQTGVSVSVGGHKWGKEGLSLSAGWHHVAVVLPDLVTPKSNNFLLYVDGSLITSSTIEGGARNVNTGNVYAQIGTVYKAFVDDLRIYNIALDAAGIQAVVNDATSVASTFTGIGDWSESARWSGGIPGATTLATISGNCTVSNNATANNLVISDVGALTVDAAVTLTSTNGTAILSENTSSGSLIVDGSLPGNVTYKRYITGVDKWHLISSPVGGQNINDFVVTNVANNAVAAISPKFGLAPYNNTTPGWAHYTTSTIAGSGDFVAGKGYEVLRTSDGTVSFTGTLATNDVDIAINKNASGWNLVGNPFPSAINAANVGTNFLSENITPIDNNYEALYVWDAANSEYITINNTSGVTYIAPGQSFFVYSVEGGGDVSFAKAMKTHQNGDIFKSGEIDPANIQIIAEAAKGTSTTKIMYFENTTIGLDPGYDAGRFSAGDNSFAVYTQLVGDQTNTVDFDIQCLPEAEFDHIIPVGLNAPENTEVMFRAETLNLPLSTLVYLEDKLNGTFTDLTEAGSFYSVNISEKTEGIGRFYLHTDESALTGVDVFGNQNELKIIPRPQNNTIRVIGSIGTKAQLSVYDIAGRKLMNANLQDIEINDVEMNGFNSGVYIIHISSSAQTTSKRISWIKY